MTPPSKILVTGAGGFVCRSIVQVLLDAGAAVVAVDQTFDAALRWAWSHGSGRLTLVESDVMNMPPFEIDAVVHGAAVTAGPEATGQSPEENFKSNLEPTLSALEWARRQHTKRFVFLSSSAVYRETAPGPVSETLPTSPLGVYAVAKQTAENLVETLRAVYRCDAVVVRLSNIYGPAEYIRPTRPRVSLVGRMIRDALETGHLVVYRDDPARDWTFAPDIGRAIHCILAQPDLTYHLYHAASGQMLGPVEIAEAIQSQLPHVRLNVRAGADPDAVPMLQRGTLSAERLREDVGFNEWTSIENGIKQVIDRECNPESVY